MKGSYLYPTKIKNNDVTPRLAFKLAWRRNKPSNISGQGKVRNLNRHRVVPDKPIFWDGSGIVGEGGGR